MNTIKSYLMKEKYGMSLTTEIVIAVAFTILALVIIFGLFGPAIQEKAEEITENIRKSGTGWNPVP